MPKRRAIGTALEGLGDALGAWFMQQDRQKEAADRQAATQEAVSGRQDQQFLHNVLTKILEKNPQTAMKFAGVKPEYGDLASPISEDISKATDPSKALTEEDIKQRYFTSGGKDTLNSTNYGGPAGLQTQRPNPGGGDFLTALQSQGAARRSMLESEAGKPNQVIYRANPDGSKTAIPVNPRTMSPEGITSEVDATQAGKNKGTTMLAGELSPEVTAAKAGQEGAVTKAREAAQLPFQLKLAQVRADMSLLNQKAMDDYRKAHPAATADQVRKHDNAISALGAIQEARMMMDEMDKRGMLGALAGRASEVAAGKIKTSALFDKPEDAQLAADYFSSIKLLSSLAAVTHGGARGGGSIQMAERFSQILSGVGDKPIVTGQLNALERLMKHYVEHPDQPGMLDIPSLQDPADQLLDQLRKRVKPMTPVPGHKVGG